ncbi:MAG: hypothetical protein NUW23_16245, partial [Firmicutes bacterium]|nr:hypothetical protein [Bacillota bacterium]
HLADAKPARELTGHDSPTVSPVRSAQDEMMLRLSSRVNWGSGEDSIGTWPYRPTVAAGLVSAPDWRADGVRHTYPSLGAARLS